MMQSIVDTTLASVERVEIHGLPAWRLRSTIAEALVTEQGAQVMSYGHPGEPEIVWSNSSAVRDAAYPLRGGIPICWPWFGALEANPIAVIKQYEGEQPAPFHGIARLGTWMYEHSVVEHGIAKLRLAMSTSPLTTPNWPYHSRLSLTVEVDTALSILLEITNQSEQSLTMTHALHTYVAVSEVSQVQLKGFDGAYYDDALQEWKRFRQEGEPNVLGEIARHYQGLPNQLELIDPGWQRQLLMETQGSQSAVLWNPGSGRARSLDQFSADAWRSMVCIEVGNVRDDAICLEPGASHRLGVRLSKRHSLSHGA